jgi:hypothetical protein
MTLIFYIRLAIIQILSQTEMCWLMRRWVSSICCLTFFCSFSSQRIKMFGRWLFRPSRQKKFMRGFGLEWCWQLFVANLETQFTQQGEDLLLVVFLETGWTTCAHLFKKKILPDPNCQRCNNRTENNMHVFLGCVRVKRLWQTLLLQLCRLDAPAILTASLPPTMLFRGTFRWKFSLLYFGGLGRAGTTMSLGERSSSKM